MKPPSYLNWLLQYKNSKERFVKIFFIIYILVLIGLIRLILEVAFGIDLNGKWYSFDRDIKFVMSVYPFYLCFFLSMAFYLVLKLFRVKVDFKKLFLLFFIFQFFHLIVPPLDWIGFKFEIPWTFEPYLNLGCCKFNPFSGATNILEFLIILTPLLIFFTSPILTTLGINTVWIIGGFFFFGFLAQELKISILKGALIFLIFFHIIYWPIYRYFFISDGLFKIITGITDYTHYGYGIYFLTFGIVGLFYFLKQTQLREEVI